MSRKTRALNPRNALMWALMPTAVQLTTGTPAVLAEEILVLEEVVVVARRREENLQQTPIAVPAVRAVDSATSNPRCMSTRCLMTRNSA